jgi:hypothetical protein
MLRTLRFFLWLVTKGKIIGNKSPTLKNLQRKIANKNAAIPPTKLVTTFAKTERPPSPPHHPPLSTRVETPISTCSVTLSPAQVLVYISLASFKRDIFSCDSWWQRETASVGLI